MDRHIEVKKHYYVLICLQLQASSFKFAREFAPYMRLADIFTKDVSSV
jgi:hypothetical protein